LLPGAHRLVRAAEESVVRGVRDVIPREKVAHAAPEHARPVGAEPTRVAMDVVVLDHVVAARQRLVVPTPDLHCSRGLCGYTRARCYSTLTFIVNTSIGMLCTKEIGEGQ
jgi:hypothetical protein